MLVNGIWPDWFPWALLTIIDCSFLLMQFCKPFMLSIFLSHLILQSQFKYNWEKYSWIHLPSGFANCYCYFMLRLTLLFFQDLLLTFKLRTFIIDLWACHSCHVKNCNTHAGVYSSNVTDQLSGKELRWPRKRHLLLLICGKNFKPGAASIERKS